jgi:hypothetical protein
MVALGSLALLTAGCTDTTSYPQDLIVISSNPAGGQSNVSQNTTMLLRFSEPPDHRTIIGTNQIIFVDQSNAPIPVSFAFQGELVTVTPASPLGPNATYGIAVRQGVRDMYGNNIATPFAAVFSTGMTVGTIPNFPPFSTTPTPQPPTQTPGTFTQTGAMKFARIRHSLTRLIGGNVLAVGGENDGPRGRVLRSAEQFNPGTYTWTMSQSLGPGINGMNFERYGHTATLLNDGRVLVAGGTNNQFIHDIAELYDPRTDVFSVVINKMQSPRCFHTAHLIGNGNVILVCGMDNNVWVNMLDTMEVYDVNSGTFNLTQSPLLPNVTIWGPLPNQRSQSSFGRMYHISEMLPDQSILVAGGYTWPWALQAPSTDDAQIYKPDVSGIGIKGNTVQTATKMTVPRVAHTSTIYVSGDAAGLVCIFGGFENVPFIGLLKSGEVFDYQQIVATGPNAGQSGVFTALAQQMSIVRRSHTQTIVNPGTQGFNDDGILITGGAQHMPPQDTMNPLPNPRGYPWLESGGHVCACTASTDLFMPFGFGKNLNEPFKGINVTGQAGPTTDINGNQNDLSFSGWYAFGVYFHRAISLANGVVLICGGCGCPMCMGGLLEWLPYANTAGANGIIYDGASIVYNP